MLATDATVEEVSAALERILASPYFQVSERNKKFFSYVVEQTLAGLGERIKAYAIAVDVFGRGPDFDGSSDSIVRAEAKRLRAGLANYYSVDGAADAIRIHLSPGSYVPRFERHKFTEIKVVDDSGAGCEQARLTAREVCAEGATEAFRILLPPGSYMPRFQRQEPAGDPAPNIEERSEPTAVGADWGPFVRFADKVRSSAGARVALAAVAALIAIVAIVAWLCGWPSRGSQSAEPTIVLAMTQPIGVAPNAPAMARGLGQSLESALVRYNGLAVARATERQPVDAIVARHQGKVGTLYILESSVDADDSRLRFRWSLVDASDQTVLWSDQNDELLAGRSSFDVEDQIAADVARVIGVRGGVVTLVEQHKQPPRAVAGYACVLRAISYTGSLSVTLHAEVRDCLEQTVREDPNYAEALALLSYVYVDEDRNGFNPRGAKADILARALAVSDRAVGLNPFSSLVQQMRSTVFFQLGDDQAFEEAARKAIALNPGNPARTILFGNRLFTMGRYEEGAALVRQGLAMEPFPSAVEHTFVLLDAYRRGDYRAAADEAAKLDIDPNFYFLSVVAAAIDGQIGDQAAAALNVAKVLKLRPDYRKTFRADWRNRRFQDDFIDKISDGLRKAGLSVE